MKLVTAAQMRDLEAQAMAAGTSQAKLMERAGMALAAETQQLLGGAAEGRNVLVLVGPGNNGGDGLVAAEVLARRGAAVRVARAAERSPGDPLLAACAAAGVDVLDAGADVARHLTVADAVIDALLGTGRSRPLAGEFLRLVQAVAAERERRPGLRIVAADLPSGADADTGAADPATLACDLTVTFGFPKHGLLRFPTADLVGRLVVADIGLPPGAGQDLPAAVLTPAAIGALLPSRGRATNKGSFGRVLSIGGCANYMGAPVMAGRAALRAGAGLATVAAPRTVSLAMAPAALEVTHIPLAESPEGGIAGTAVDELQDAVGRYEALVVGCGMGQSAGAGAFVEALLLDGLTIEGGLVLDADALNLLARVPEWWEALPPNAVLTPHPGEMARLLGATVREVQADRVATAASAAERWGRVVVLKGAYTVIAAPGGAVAVAPFANAALATAGTGDVLAGAMGALLAQGLTPWDAARAAVFIHGLAGELFRVQHGDAGLLAAELADYLPGVLRDLRAGRADWPGIVSWRPASV